MFFQPFVLSILLIGQGTRTALPSCAPDRGRMAEQIQGEVTNGQAFSKSASGGWILKLVPSEHGWFLEVTMKGREKEDLAFDTTLALRAKRTRN